MADLRTVTVASNSHHTSIKDISKLLRDFSVDSSTVSRVASTSAHCVNAFRLPKLRHTSRPAAHLPQNGPRSRCRHRHAARRFSPYERPTLPPRRRKYKFTSSLKNGPVVYEQCQAFSGVLNAYKNGAKLEVYSAELSDMAVLPNVDISDAFASGKRRCRNSGSNSDLSDNDDGVLCGKRRLSPSNSNVSQSAGRCSVQAFRAVAAHPSISVDELAAYFEDYFHLPKKMSVMADNIHMEEAAAGAETKKWVCIYPTYINSKKTIAEGRRIAKAKAVDTPTSGEIRDVLTHAGLECLVEDKMYPRDPCRDMQFQGRVRVNLLDAQGAPHKADLQSRTALYIYAAENIPKLKTRVQKAGPAQPDAGPAQTAQFPPAKSAKKKVNDGPHTSSTHMICVNSNFGYTCRSPDVQCHLQMHTLLKNKYYVKCMEEDGSATRGAEI